MNATSAGSNCNGPGPDPRSAVEIHGVDHFLCHHWRNIRQYVDKDANAMDFSGFHNEQITLLQGMCLLALAMDMNDLFDDLKLLSGVARESFHLQVRGQLEHLKKVVA